MGHAAVFIMTTEWQHCIVASYNLSVAVESAIHHNGMCAKNNIHTLREQAIIE